MSDAGNTKKGAKTAKMAQCTMCGALYAKARQAEFVAKRVNLPEQVARMCPACRRKTFLKETEKKLAPDASVARP